MSTEENELAWTYALAKQLDRAYALETTYGTLQLDEEMRAAVEKALRPLLTKRLDKTKFQRGPASPSGRSEFNVATLQDALK